jgi:hypothetical protein
MMRTPRVHSEQISIPEAMPLTRSRCSTRNRRYCLWALMACRRPAAQKAHFTSIRVNVRTSVRIQVQALNPSDLSRVLAHTTTMCHMTPLGSGLCSRQQAISTTSTSAVCMEHFSHQPQMISHLMAMRQSTPTKKQAESIAITTH